MHLLEMLFDFVEPLLAFILVSSHNLEGGNWSKICDSYNMIHHIEAV